jgi:hypothetical protein
MIQCRSQPVRVVTAQPLARWPHGGEGAQTLTGRVATGEGIVNSQLPTPNSQGYSSNDMGERRTNTLLGAPITQLARPHRLGSWELEVGSCQKAGLLTVTVNVARPSLPRVLEAQQLTTVLPIAKVDPERGRQ